MTKGGSVAKSKYAMLEAVISAEPTHIETQKNRRKRSVRKRGTSAQTDESDKRFRAATFCRPVFPQPITMAPRTATTPPQLLDPAGQESRVAGPRNQRSSKLRTPSPTFELASVDTRLT